MPVATSSTRTIAEVANDLVWAALRQQPHERVLTLIGVSVGNLIGEHGLQLEMPFELGDERRRPGSALGAARWRVDRSMDEVRARFGRQAVGYAAVAFSDVTRVPDAFRELAERS